MNCQLATASTNWRHWMMHRSSLTNSHFKCFLSADLNWRGHPKDFFSIFCFQNYVIIYWKHLIRETRDRKNSPEWRLTFECNATKQLTLNMLVPSLSEQPSTPRIKTCTAVYSVIIYPHGCSYCYLYIYCACGWPSQFGLMFMIYRARQ